MADEPATKADLEALRTEVSALRAELKSDVSRVAMMVLRLDAKLEARADREDAKMSAFRSEMLAATEGAVIAAQKVDRDQLYTRDRLDLIERRLAALEAGRRRKST